MALLDYTSFDEVRAALGVSKDEISDTTLSLDLYYFNLVSELEGVNLSLIGAYTTQKGTSPAIWTALQTRLHQTIHLFSAYAVAKQATISLPMFSPKEQTDGKSSLVRFSQDPYKATITRVFQQFDAFRIKLEAAYAASLSIGAPDLILRPYFSAGSPNSDPVLGT